MTKRKAKIPQRRKPAKPAAAETPEERRQRLIRMAEARERARR